MSKEKNFLENDFVSYKNEKIVFCQDGRIFSIDKDTELVDLRDCENCKQKDQRISDLERENKRLNTKLEIWNRFDKEDYIHRGEKATERDYYYYTNGVSTVLDDYEQKDLEISQLKFELEELKKQIIEKDKLLENSIILELEEPKPYYIIKNKKIIECRFCGQYTGLRKNIEYFLLFYPPNRKLNGIYKVDEIYLTKQEAEEALRKLEGK